MNKLVNGIVASARASDQVIDLTTDDETSEPMTPCTNGLYAQSKYFDDVRKQR